MGKQLTVLILMGLVGGLLLPGSSAQDKKDDLPADLDRVPRNAAYFVTIRLADQWKGETFKPLREKLTKDEPELLKVFEKALGVPLEEVERLTVVGQDLPDRSRPVLLIGTASAYDREQVLARFGKGTQEKAADQTIFITERAEAIWFIPNKAYAVGRLPEVPNLIKAAGKKDGPLSAALNTAAGKNQYVVGLNGTAFAKLFDQPGAPEIPAAFKPLLKTTFVTVTANLDNEGLKAEARLSFAGAADAKAAEPAVKAALEQGRGALTAANEQLSKLPDVPKVFVEVWKNLEVGVKEAKVSLKDTDLEVSGAVKIEPKAVDQLIVESVKRIREAARRMEGTNNLHQLAIGMHAYHDANGTLPAPAIYDKNGKPLLSWRVMVLPYLGGQQLYKEFHLDEPWDSEHNKQLLAKMPKLFAAPDAAAGTTDTPYQVFTGKDTVFSGPKGMSLAMLANGDGTSNTIMIAEAVKAVPWTKPEDIAFDNNKLLPRLVAANANGFQVAMCDGSVRSISKTVEEKVLRWAIMPFDGNPLPPDF